jgi:hypothetical protein
MSASDIAIVSAIIAQTTPISPLDPNLRQIYPHLSDIRLLCDISLKYEKRMR